MSNHDPSKDAPLTVGIPPKALEALGLSGRVQPAQNRPLDPAVIRAIFTTVALAAWGPSMKPRFKFQLLAFVSFNAINWVWAADNFQRVYREKQDAEPR